MGKNVAIVVLAVLALAAAGMNVYQGGQVRVALDRAARAEATATKEATESEIVRKRMSALLAKVSENGGGNPESVALKARVRELETTLATERSRKPTATEQTADKDTKEADERSPMANIAEMLKNPAMKDMIRAQQKGAIDISYASLFKYLELSDEEQDTLKELLVNRQMELMDTGMAMMGGDMSAEEKQARAEQVMALTEAYNDKIKELLGEDDYGVYKEFEGTQPERMQVNLFKQSLGAGQALTEDQEHNLILALHDERESFSFSSSLNDQENFDSSELTAEVMERHMQEMGQLNEKYLARAGEILSEPQMDQFRTSMQQQRAMQEMGMKMAQQMFRAPEGEAKGE